MNSNSPKYLSDMTNKLLQQLKKVEAVPSVEFQPLMRDLRDLDEANAKRKDMKDPDGSTKEMDIDSQAVPSNEFFDPS